MRTPIALALAAAIALPGLARAQASVSIHFDLPVVLPPVVVVRPGVVVVPEVHEEVFVHDRWYYARRDGHWYRTRDHRGGWVLVPARAVPPRLVGIPPGQYRNWKAEKAAAKAERKAAKERRKAEKHDHDHDHGHGHGHGKGHGRGH